MREVLVLWSHDGSMLLVWASIERGLHSNFFLFLTFEKLFHSRLLLVQLRLGVTLTLLLIRRLVSLFIALLLIAASTSIEIRGHSKRTSDLLRLHPIRRLYVCWIKLMVLS